MANTKQARKRVRQDIEHNLRLTAQRTRYRTAIKAVEKLVAAGNKAAAAEEFKKTSGILEAEVKDMIAKTMRDFAATLLAQAE